MRASVDWTSCVNRFSRLSSSAWPTSHSSGSSRVSCERSAAPRAWKPVDTDRHSDDPIRRFHFQFSTRRQGS